MSHATLKINNVLNNKYYSQIGLDDQGWYGALRSVTLFLKAQF